MCQDSSLISQPIYSNILQFYRAKLFFTFLSLFFPCYLMLMCKVSNRLSAKIQFFSYSDSLPALSGDLSKFGFFCQFRVKHSAPSWPHPWRPPKAEGSTRRISALSSHSQSFVSEQMLPQPQQKLSENAECSGNGCAHSLTKFCIKCYLMQVTR